MLRLLLAFSLVFLTACGSTRAPVPTGNIPSQGPILTEDEQYGHQVFQELAQKFPLDTDDGRILRVRGITEKLTAVRQNNKNIWHVYVFNDDSFHNAAATRGNYIFVWSGLINAIPDDGELATILAHEIGHVLAGHTQPDPGEEVNQMLSELAGTTARSVMRTVGNTTVGGLASLGGLLAVELLKVFIVNPDQQNLELEADKLGVFVMAEAGYNPEKAVRFWEKAKNDPKFGGHPIEFLSSHPSSAERLEALKEVMPQAIARYNGQPLPPAPTNTTTNTTSTTSTSSGSFVISPPPASPPTPTNTTSSAPLPAVKSSASVIRFEAVKEWEVMDHATPVYPEPDSTGTPVDHLDVGKTVTSEYRKGRWLKISSPVEGFIASYHLSPLH